MGLSSSPSNNGKPTEATLDCYELRWFTDDIIGPAFILLISALMYWLHPYRFPNDLLYLGATIFFFLILSLLLSSLTGRYRFCDDKIVHKNLFGMRQIYWSEVQKFEGGPHWEHSREPLLLLGGDKQFLVAAPATWLSPHKAQILALMRKKCSQGSWALRAPRRGASSPRSKNVKVRE